MNVVPIETVENIIYFIETSSSDSERQHALSVLARINKTFNRYLSRKLYLKPVLTSEKRVELWSRTYWARSNPWNLCDPQMSLNNVIVPETLTFSAAEDEEDIYDDSLSRFLVRQPGSRGDTSLILSSPFASFYFRNLTTLTISTGVSAPSSLLVALLGPQGFARSNIRSLSLEGEEQHTIVLYLFEAVLHLTFDWDEMAMIDYFHDVLSDERFDRYDWYSDEFEDAVRFRAHQDFDVFQRLSFTDGIGDEYDDYFSQYQPTGWAGQNAFTNLVSLTLDFKINTEVLLVFWGTTFARLRRLTLSGGWIATEHLFEDLKIWRYAIAHDGYMLPPEVEDSVSRTFPTLFNGYWWQAMNRYELDELDLDFFVGVNLDVLDLSGSWITG